MPTTTEAPFRASRYTTGAIVLHWTIALLVIAQITGGYLMTEVLGEGSQAQYTVFQLHKSVGVTILVLTVARILWRTFNPPPVEPASVSTLERQVSGAVHATFYALLLIIPLSGWLLITVSRIQVETELYFVDWLPWPHLPGFASVSAEGREQLADVSEGVHVILAYAMGTLVLLHVAGALKHQLAGGGFLSRMGLGRRGDGARNAYGHATTWLVTVAFAASMIGAAALARRDGKAIAATGVSPDQARVLGSGPADRVVVGKDLRDVAVAVIEPATPAGPASWTLVPADSTVAFAVDYQGARLEGTIGSFRTDIRFDPDDLAASSISATLDLDSATIAGDGISATQLEGPDGLAIATSPTATFAATEIVALEEGGYEARGTLALRGVEAPVTLRFTLDIEGDTATAAGLATLDRLTYGVAQESDPAGGTLAPQVEVAIDLTATRG